MSETATMYQVWNAIYEDHKHESAWLDARRSMIGASESAAIFGVGYKSSSPITIWNSKVGGPSLEFDEPTLKRMNRGKRLEPFIAGEFSDETGILVEDPGDYAIYRSNDKPWMGASIDRVAVHPEFGPIPLELKAVNGRFRSEWDDEEPPLKYVVQCQHQMYVTGTDHCYLVGWIGGDELAVRLLERDDKFLSAMLPVLEAFWRHVEDRTMPPVDDSEATKAILGMIYPRDDGDEVSLPIEAAEWDRELLEVKDSLKQLESRKTLLENQLRAAIGEASKGVLPGGGGGYSWKKQFRAEHVVAASEFRVLRRTNK